MQLDSHKHKTKFAWDMLAIFALALCVASSSYCQTLPAPSTPRHPPLRLNSVEPPNWWIGLPNPMLLIKGENLTAAKVTISSQPATPASSGKPVPNGRHPNRANAKLRGAVSVARTEEGLNGKYLFVWIDIAKSAVPGTMILDVAVGGEQAKIKFPLLQRRRSPQSNFSLASDDLIYRFNPEESDRANPERKTANSNLPSPLRHLQDKLPDLKELGFTTISLPPPYKQESPRRSAPSAPISFYSIDQRLGSLDDFKSFVSAAHELGMKVSVDLVANQVSHAHLWASDPPTAKWFHGTEAHHFPASTKLRPLTDPHATPQETRFVTEGWIENTFPDLNTPDLNTEDPWVSQYLRQNAVLWTSHRLARLGASAFHFHALPKRDPILNLRRGI